jgi:NAD-dependent deacetylase
MASSNRLRLAEDTRLLVLTGAGISAESGLATFRGTDGLWEGLPVEDVATPQGFARDPELVWRFYSERRAAAAGVEPNDAHRALAAVERQLGDRFLLVTQNIDGLHQRAGSQRVVELHGSLWLRRCSRCGRPSEEDRVWPVSPPLPVCDRCVRPDGDKALLRPSLIWFGEQLEHAAYIAAKAFLHDARQTGCPIAFLAVGTSGNVYPAAGYVLDAATAGADTWLANLEPAMNDRWFGHVVLGPATQVLPELLGLA